MGKVVNQFIDPVTGRHMSEIDMGGSIVTVPSEAAGLPVDQPLGKPPVIPSFDDTGLPPPAISPPALTPKSKAPEVIEDTATPQALMPQPAQNLAPPMVAETENSFETRSLSGPMQAERARATDAMNAAAIRANTAIDSQTQQAIKEADEKAKFAQESAEQEQIRQEETARRVEEQFGKFQTAADKYAGDKIDSKRYWANASTADKIMAGIGLLAGAWAYGRGVTDRNYGAEYIQTAIDRDIKEQEANLQNSRVSADMQRTLYTDLRQQGLDQAAAAAKAREFAYNALEMKLSGMAAASKSEAAKASLAQQMAEFKTKAANEAMQFNTITERQSQRAAPALAKVRDPSEELLAKKAKAEVGIKGLHKLEDNLQKLVDKGEAGGMTNYIVAVAKDKLGMQTNPDLQEAWKAWENLLVEERAKVFGASLTESERKSFEQAVVTFKDRPENLMRAIKNIRSKTEDLYKSEMSAYSGANIRIPPTVGLRIDTEADATSGKVKKAPSFK